MRKLFCVLALGLTAAPAAAELGWSEFVPVHRGYGCPYIVFAPGDYIRTVSRDDGYFEHGGGVDVRNGKAMFDYDRDYPYDYPSYSLASLDEEREAMREPSCTIERVRDGKSGWADVRVCRN
jgi:hypothetical protein